MPKFMRSLVMWLGMLLAVTTPASSQTYFVQQPGIDFKTTAWHTRPLADDAPIDPNSAILVPIASDGFARFTNNHLQLQRYAGVHCAREPAHG